MCGILRDERFTKVHITICLCYKSTLVYRLLTGRHKFTEWQRQHYLKYRKNTAKTMNNDE